MNEVLSNDEIDALLELFETEGLPEDLVSSDALESGVGGLGGDRIAPLDLLKPNRFTRDQLTIIERVQEMVARKLGSTIADRLWLDTSCDCVAVEQLRFATWIAQVPTPSGVYVVDFKPLELPAVVTISAELLYGIVDRVLGGSGRAAEVPKELSEAEYAVADALMLPIVERLAEGVQEVTDVTPSILGRYTSVVMAQALPLHEVVLAVHFQVAGQPLLGDIRMAIPYASLERHLDRLSKSRFVTTASHAGEFREVLASTVGAIPMELGVCLGRTEIRLNELLELEVGDIVPLSTKPGDLVPVPVQGRTKFLGQLGTRGNRYAVRIRRVAADDSAEGTS